MIVVAEHSHSAFTGVKATMALCQGFPFRNSGRGPTSQLQARQQFRAALQPPPSIPQPAYHVKNTWPAAVGSWRRRCVTASSSRQRGGS